MSHSSLDDRRKAMEEGYFEKKNREALERIKARSKESKKPTSPIDGAELEDFAVNGVVVAKCKSSGGLWITRDELKQLITTIDDEDDTVKFLDSFSSEIAREAGAGESAARGEEARKSPVTGKDMEKIVVANQLVDRCSETGGIWFDAGELEALMNREKEKDNFLVGFLRGLVG